MNRIKNIFFTLVIFVGLVGSAIWWKASKFLHPSAMDSSQNVVVDVAPGSTYSEVILQMKAKGIIDDVLAFKVYVRTTHAQVKVGEYLLYKHMPPAEIVKILASGKSVERLITVPEGANIFEVAALMSRAGFGKPEKIVAMILDAKFAKTLLGEDHSSLEGYLFPETYAYTKYTTAEGLIRQMVSMFFKVFESISLENRNHFRNGLFYPDHGHPLSRHEVVTLASIVEKETGAAQERPMIAAVFHNRLVKKNRLETDPTVIYGLWRELGHAPQNITRSDLRRDLAYNTYTRMGLPPGPIANPGREALQAALNPADVPYIFFVSRNDGTHVFSVTYADHSKAVGQFQVDSKARAGKSWRDLDKEKRANRK